MGNLLEIQRVVYEHDWQSPVDWARAIDELAHLSDDEIDRLARRNPQMETKTVCNRGQLPASRIMLQVICSKIGSRLRSTVSKSVALMLPRARH
jgi:hypothetical protein